MIRRSLMLTAAKLLVMGKRVLLGAESEFGATRREDRGAMERSGPDLDREPERGGP